MDTFGKVPVVILNGFLGSGKTTLFRSLLAQSKKNNIRTFAIVNDMSELDVDGALIANTVAVEEDNSILQSISSCVLSSKKGIQKLDEAIQKLLSGGMPELLIIETSGSCHPMPLIQYFEQQEELQLTGVFALVDSLMLAHDYEYGETLVPQMQQNLATGIRGTVNLLVEQILFCSHLILTKADRIAEDRLQHIASFIQNINPYASTHSVFFGKLDIQSLFEIPEYDYYKVAQLITELEPELAAEEKSDNPYNMETKVIKDDRPFHPQRLWDVCHKYLDKRIYRSKGFFWLATRDKYALLWNQAAGSINLELIGTWKAGIVESEDHGITQMEIDILQERLNAMEGRFGDRYCDLTVIGDVSQVEAFAEKLQSCFLTDEELLLWESDFEFEDPWPTNIVKMKN
ncbi:MAG: CobW family GTP-binding protein [Flavicella sp.]